MVSQLQDQGAEGVRKEDRWDDPARFTVTIDFGVPYYKDLEAELTIQIATLASIIAREHGIDQRGVTTTVERDGK